MIMHILCNFTWYTKNMLLILYRGIFEILSHSFVWVSLCIFIRIPKLAKKLIVMCLTIYANYFKSFYSAELLNTSIFHISQLDLFDFIIYSNGFCNIFNIDICAFYFVDGKWKSMEICTLFNKKNWRKQSSIDSNFTEFH